MSGISINLSGEAGCEARLSFSILDVQTVWIHQEIINVHGKDTFLVLVSRSGCSYDDDFLETVFYAQKRVELLFHFFFCWQGIGRLYVASLIAQIANEIDF